MLKLLDRDLQSDSDFIILPKSFVELIEQGVLRAIAVSPAPPVRGEDFCWKWACMQGAISLAESLAAKPLSHSILSQGLQLAATCGHENVLELILSVSKRACFRIPLDEPLFQACSRVRQSIVKRLLQELDSQDLSAPINLNEHLAVSCKRGSIAQVDMILSNFNASKSKRILGPFVAVTPTISKGHVEILRLLLDFDPTIATSITLTPAVEDNHLYMVKFLLSLPITFTFKDVGSAFHLACENGHVEIATRLLLPSPISPSQLPSLEDTDLTMSLLVAVEANHPEIVELLLMHAYCDVTVENNRAIRYAASHGFTRVVHLLLDIEGDVIDPSALDNLALRNACERGYAEIVKRLLEDPVVDAGDADNACLRNACEYGHVEVVKMLLALGEIVDPSAKNSYAARAAARNEHWEVVDLLVADGRSDLTALCDLMRKRCE
ncbi:hypothetical protein HDU98_006216 [Podochytrium sp. JEL0797]|nr:hypothetical protein HDU98_006216 [Podochytrium sp. JEL0797]